MVSTPNYQGRRSSKSPPPPRQGGLRTGWRGALRHDMGLAPARRSTSPSRCSCKSAQHLRIGARTRKPSLGSARARADVRARARPWPCVRLRCGCRRTDGRTGADGTQQYPPDGRDRHHVEMERDDQAGDPRLRTKDPSALLPCPAPPRACTTGCAHLLHAIRQWKRARARVCLCVCVCACGCVRALRRAARVQSCRSGSQRGWRRDGERHEG